MAHHRFPHLGSAVRVWRDAHALRRSIAAIFGSSDRNFQDQMGGPSTSGSAGFSPSFLRSPRALKGSPS